MAEEEIQPDAGQSKPKIDLKKWIEIAKAIDWKDRKNQIKALAGVLLLLVLFFMLKGSPKESEQTDKETISTEKSTEKEATFSKAVTYSTLSAGKNIEFMATINDKEKVLSFSMVMGLEKETVVPDVDGAMAPLLAETLRFLSSKTREEILDMIQDPDEAEKTKLLTRLNGVLEKQGVKLEEKGYIVSVSFTKYFFPSL